MEVTASLVKELRDKTGAGMMDCKKALTEAQGNVQAACEDYAETAQRWRRFGVVPEQAYALLGQGRCLAGLGRPTEGTVALQEGRRIFGTLKAVSALAEIDSLLAGAIAITS